MWGFINWFSFYSFNERRVRLVWVYKLKYFLIIKYYYSSYVISFSDAVKFRIWLEVTQFALCSFSFHREGVEHALRNRTSQKRINEDLPLVKPRKIRKREVLYAIGMGEKSRKEKFIEIYNPEINEWSHYGTMIGRRFCIYVICQGKLCSLTMITLTNTYA